MMLSLDCETTGLDLRHGCKPFLVTICDEEGNNTYWEWDVDPLTREPAVPYNNLEEITWEIADADCVVMQNPKFDVLALQTVFAQGGHYSGVPYWNWGKTYDTLLAGHLLCSNDPHDLTSMTLKYLGIDLQPYEDAVGAAVKKARNICRRDHPDWRIAKKGDPQLPSAAGWKNDMWLLRCFDKEDTLCSDYANADSASTLPLFEIQRKLLKERGLWDIYLERLKLLPIVHEMENAGVTLSSERLQELTESYRKESDKAGRTCVSIAKSYGADLVLPKSGNNNSLLETVFDKMELEPITRSKKTGNPSLDKATLEHFEATLPERSKKLRFVTALKGKRKRDTALSYMEGYEKFWLPLGNGWYILHPSLNPTGTHTLRWSSSNPNEQNISRQPGFNIRYCFGPAPGREWWSLDANNIELRIPAYEADETEMVDLFNRPNDPPYYGSYHMLIFDTLHPKMFEKYGMDCKKEIQYQWTKNGDFAVQYGAIESSGTADRAYHVQGAQHRIQKRFSKIAKLNQQMIDVANRQGYVETIPDETVDPNRGYPLYCGRTQWGGVSPTIPLNYHVQGTACWWMQKAMARCHEHLKGTDVKMVMQVHDELVFDFPYKKNKGNLPKIKKIKRLMEEGGNDIGVPTPVGVEYHPNNWSESE